MRIRRTGSETRTPGATWLARAACAAALVLAGASGQELKITELTTYAGTVACPDCVGIKEVLSLRPDGTFFQQRSYLKTQISGQRVMDLGSWRAGGARLELETSLGEAQTFEILANGELRALDAAGRPAMRAPAQGDAKSPATFVREAQAYVPQGTYRLRGIYTQVKGRMHFQPCGMRDPLAMETSGRPKLMEKLAEATKGGRPALLTVSGAFEPAAGGKELVRIANVVTAEPGGSCGVHSDAAGPRTELREGANLLPAGDQKAQNETSAPLVDTPWVLTELPSGPVPAGARHNEPTIRFSNDGRVAGFSGCNRFSGSYTVDGRQLRFGQIAMTQMACAEGMGVENEYMKSLESTRQYQIHRGILELQDAAGHLTARFKTALGR